VGKNRRPDGKAVGKHFLGHNSYNSFTDAFGQPVGVALR